MYYTEQSDIANVTARISERFGVMNYFGQSKVIGFFKGVNISKESSKLIASRLKI